MSGYAVPYVVERTPNGERSMDVFSRLLVERIVYLGTEIDDGVANVLIAQLLYLDSYGSDQPIGFYINSPGGSTTAMLAVYDAMQHVGAPVETTCVGQAASAAAVLLAAGAPGRRSVLPHARVVLHQPAAQGQGTIPDLILEAEEIARTREQLEQVLARHTGRSPQQVREDTDRDLVLTAEEAVAYGVAARDGTGGRGAVEQHPGGPLGEIDQVQPQGTDHRGDDLRGGVLHPALDLGEVLRGDPGDAGHLRQRQPLRQAVAAQEHPQHGPPQRVHGRSRRGTLPRRG